MFATIKHPGQADLSYTTSRDDRNATKKELRHQPNPSASFPMTILKLQR
jgi:hypothetical protein